MKAVAFIWLKLILSTAILLGAFWLFIQVVGYSDGPCSPSPGSGAGKADYGNCE
jgi:hypothetical protein